MTQSVQYMYHDVQKAMQDIPAGVEALIEAVNTELSLKPELLWLAEVSEIWYDLVRRSE